MRKRLIVLTIACLVAAGTAVSLHAATPLLRVHARHVIRRTAVVLVAAQKAAQKGHRYFGLARAVAHQSYARRLYVRGFYLDAIFHSLRARTLAVNVIKLNGARLVKEAILDDIEKGYAKKAPPDQELDKKIEGQNIGTDEAAVKVKIEPDID